MVCLFGYDADPVGEQEGKPDSFQGWQLVPGMDVKNDFRARDVTLQDFAERSLQVDGDQPLAFSAG